MVIAITKNDLISHIFIYAYKHKMNVNKYRYDAYTIKFKYGYNIFYSTVMSTNMYRKIMMFLPIQNISFEKIDENIIAIPLSHADRFFEYYVNTRYKNKHEERLNKIKEKFYKVFNKNEYVKERVRYGIKT